MRTLREYRKELLGNQYDTNNIGSLIEERRKSMVREYSNMGFNWQSVLRLKNNQNYNESQTRVYNNKMSIDYVDRVMDKLVKRKAVDVAVAFIEQDNYHNNHLHFAWRSQAVCTRQQVANAMRTHLYNLRDVLPIQGELKAMEYFSKRVGKTGFYSNIYA